MKNFDEWNNLKKTLESLPRLEVRKGGVWICNFGLNIGYEIDGKNEDYIRPALVLVSFGKGGGIVLPLTSIDKKGKYLIPLNEISKVNLTQIRYLDSKRFKRFLYNVCDTKFNEIRDGLFKIL